MPSPQQLVISFCWKGTFVQHYTSIFVGPKICIIRLQCHTLQVDYLVRMLVDVVVLCGLLGYIDVMAMNL